MTAQADQRSVFGRANWLLLSAALWLGVALLLITHFRFYYHVDWRDAVKWGVGDGLLWTFLFAAFVYAAHQFQSAMQTWRGRTLFMSIAILGGVLFHPTLSTLFFWAIDGSISRPFHEDVLHLLMKRLPQGILAGGVIGIASLLMTRMQVSHERPMTPGETKPASTPQWITLKDASSVRRIALADILYLEAAGNYVALHAIDAEHLHRSTLKAIEESLGKNRFFRISRKHIVNLDNVRSLQAAKPKGGLVMLDNGAALPVSRQYKEALQTALLQNADANGPLVDVEKH